MRAGTVRSHRSEGVVARGYKVTVNFEGKATELDVPADGTTILDAGLDKVGAERETRVSRARGRGWGCGETECLRGGGGGLS
jgi:hypothetical protein